MAWAEPIDVHAEKRLAIARDSRPTMNRDRITRRLALTLTESRPEGSVCPLIWGCLAMVDMTMVPY
jgi:hypothetical protein